MTTRSVVPDTALTAVLAQPDAVGAEEEVLHKRVQAAAWLPQKRHRQQVALWQRNGTASRGSGVPFEG